MTKKDIEIFVEDIRTSSLRDFTAPAKSESSILYSEKSIKFNVKRTVISVPELVQFIFVFILRLPAYGPGEKLRWEIPFHYKNIPCAFALEKFGLRLYILSLDNHASDINKVAQEIIGKTRKSIHRVEKTLLVPFAEEQIKNGHITIANQYHSLMNRYIYFREKAEKVLIKMRNKIKGKYGIEQLTILPNYIFRSKSELFYNTIAMLDAYFSFLEHFFVLILPLQRDDVNLLQFISSSWADKFKLLFDIKSDSKVKSFYDKLSNIKECYRNFYAHGSFEKGGASLYIHFPGIGAIPAQFSKIKNSPVFDFFPIQEDNFKDMCRIINDFDKWLRSEGSRMEKAIRYIESGLDLPCDKQSLERIRSSMETEEKLDALINCYSHLWEMHANMDY